VSVVGYTIYGITLAVAIVPAAGCTYPELLFRHKNLDYFQEKTKIKKVAQVGLEPTHSHSQGSDVTHRLTGASSRPPWF